VRLLGPVTCLSAAFGTLLHHSIAPAPAHVLGDKQATTVTLHHCCISYPHPAVCCSPAELIEQARRRMQATSATREASVVLESLLGEGTFGKVYSGMP